MNDALSVSENVDGSVDWYFVWKEGNLKEDLAGFFVFENMAFSTVMQIHSFTKIWCNDV